MVVNSGTECIPTGNVVLILLPVNLLSSKDVTNWNRVLQVGPDLYSCSLSPESQDNFIAHSCDPNCTVHINPDYSVTFVATRDIHQFDPISFDYNSTEWDMVQQGVDFECSCSSPKCQKWIKGKRYLDTNTKTINKNSSA